MAAISDSTRLFADIKLAEASATGALEHMTPRQQPTIQCQASAASVAALNGDCYCRTLDNVALRRGLLDNAESGELMAQLLAQRPTLFSATAVFLSQNTLEQIVTGIASLERVIRSCGYQAAALQQAPPIAARAFGPVGAFVSYDFHLAPDGPRLIEINSNAGGAMLGAALAQAQHTCCQAMSEVLSPSTVPTDPRHAFLAMFREEWRRQHKQGAPRNILIVDDDPSSQYLAPEFQLFRRLLTRNLAPADIADATALEWRDGRLWHQGESIDMIYNRLTDFYIAEPRHGALREAYEAGAVVVTPNPRTHALYADKRNLIDLGDARILRQWDIPAEDIERLVRLVPATQLVTPDNAEALWARRRALFFKPAAGYGAKAAYRGDKLTRRVWGEILAGTYIAQALVMPGERAIEVDGVRTRLKFDLRAYTYDGCVQLLTARMYSGQTTNFRTPGGGFAPVFFMPECSPTFHVPEAAAS